MINVGSFMHLQRVVRLLLPFFYFPKAKEPCASQMMMMVTVKRRMVMKSSGSLYKTAPRISSLLLRFSCNLANKYFSATMHSE